MVGAGPQSSAPHPPNDHKNGGWVWGDVGPARSHALSHTSGCAASRRCVYIHPGVGRRRAQRRHTYISRHGRAARREVQRGGWRGVVMGGGERRGESDAMMDAGSTSRRRRGRWGRARYAPALRSQPAVSPAVRRRERDRCFPVPTALPLASDAALTRVLVCGRVAGCDAAGWGPRKRSVRARTSPDCPAAVARSASVDCNLPHRNRLQDLCFAVQKSVCHQVGAPELHKCVSVYLTFRASGQGIAGGRTQRQDCYGVQ